MSRTYLSKKRAEKFAEELKAQGYKPQIWIFRDAFGQDNYSVKW
jgi:hypothetical protein